jgi:long-chain acyl-CoA synthetase
MKLVDLLKNSCEQHPRAKAVCASSGRDKTYSALYSDCLSLSEVLRGKGMTPGVKVGLYLENSVEFLVSFFAVSAASCIIVPLYREMTLYELTGSVSTADLSVVITDATMAAKLSHSDLEVTVIGLQYRDDRLEIQVIKEGSVIIDEENTEVALIVPTSGTTGRPKYVLLTDEQLVSNLRQYLKVMEFADTERAYCALPFSHIYTITAQILAHISRGDSFVIDKGRFFVKDFFRTVQQHGVTMTAFVPYLAILMAEFPSGRQYDLASLRQVTLSGAKTPVSTYLKLQQMYPDIRFINTYGMSEAGSRIAIAAPDPLCYPPDSVGKPLPEVSVKIINTNGRVLAADMMGEICIKSSGLMKGYYQSPELTEEVFSDGWLKTGDLGKMDEAGNLFIEGRLKEMIISGGKNISPYEIEECLLKHTKVLEAAVVAKKHPIRQEVPYTFIVCAENTSIEYAEIIAHCRRYLSSYKVPQGFETLKSLPKISASKINRRRLAQMLIEDPIS